TFTTLTSFTDGFRPGNLTVGADGNYYGTTVAGGTTYDGTVFQATPRGRINTLVNIHSTFWEDRSALTMDRYGDFYGVTYDGLIYTVVIPLTITLQPQDTFGIEGKPATFEVAAIAPAPITNSIFYQWQKDGVNLSDHGNTSGATSNIL